MSDAELHFTAPITIGVIADTHVYVNGHRQVSPAILEFFRRQGTGLILHCGDINVQPVLDALNTVAPVLAVAGNSDEPRLLDSLPEVVRFKAGTFSFILIHGHKGKTARAAARAYAGRCDCVVYGHSHIPKMEMVEGTVLFNPGSATDRRWGAHFGVGLITVTATRCVPDLILFNEPGELAKFGVAAEGPADG